MAKALWSRGCSLPRPHAHTNEDEISYVVEGEIGVLLSEEVHTAPAGSYVLKPRGVVHTFSGTPDPRG
jgi:quercetin dioxygenase-like cupin family protein